MTLKDIVAYINLLDSLSISAETQETVRLLASVLHVVDTHSVQLDSYSKTLEQNFSSITAGVDNFANTLAQLKQRLHQLVKEYEPQYFTESKRIFDHEMPFERTDYILNRQLGIDEHSNILLRSHLKNLGDWKIPGMIIRPGTTSFIEDLVPMDPLYLVDQHQDLIRPSVLRFAPEYQRRLREYVITDRTDQPIMAALPQGQFGLVFAYNYFNYKPIEIIRRYLSEIYALLRPGGVLIMTYNNCDRAQGVGLAERNFMCYTPERYIRQHAESVGFELTFSHNGDGDVSWLEFGRPGKITSLRGGQTLAKILAQSK
jgi:SAM-dependent methyltransferase